MSEGTSSYSIGNLGNNAISLQGEHITNLQVEHLSLTVNMFPAAPRSFSYRGIAGVPPSTDQQTIQQRTQLVETIYTRLVQPGINAIVLTGIGGVGKSTLAALVSRYAEAQQSADNRFFHAPPLWLSIDQAATFADVIGTLFQRLDCPLPVLENLSPAGQVEALFAQLDQLALPRLIVLDQFDHLLDWFTGRPLPAQPGVGELLDALNSRPWQSSCRLLLTSRSFPRGTREAPATYLHDYAINGLTQQEGQALFHSRGIEAPEALLQSAVTFCDGHPLSLVLLIALMQLYKLPLVDLLAEPTLWIGDIATNLLDAMFQRLTEEQRAILRALSVYRMAVPVAALAPFLKGSTPQQILLSLRPLLVQQVIQSAGTGYYQVHAVVARYMQTHFVEGNQSANRRALRAAHAKAARYYLKQIQTTVPAREQRRRIADAQEIIEAVWQYTQAAQWQKAYILIEQEDLLGMLFSWGGTFLLLDLCQWFLAQSEWQPEPGQTTTIYLYLGKASSTQGNKQQALAYYEQALTLCREAGNRTVEGTLLNNMGLVYNDLGNKQQALAYYEQALTLCREAGNRAVEGTLLNNIGLIYALSNKQDALAYYQQALTTCREIGDRESEGTILNNIGRVYNDLGDKQQALVYYEQGLMLCREVGNRAVEGRILNNTGQVYHNLDDQQQALASYQQALTIGREVGDRAVEGMALNNVAQVYHNLGDSQQALAYYQEALTICREIGDYRTESMALNNTGRVYHNLGAQQQALASYQQALTIGREVGDREIEGTTQWNIGDLALAQGHYDLGLAALLLAKDCFEVASSPRQHKIEEWIAALCQHVGQEQFTALRTRIEPQAQQFFEQALHDFMQGDHKGLT